MRYLYRKILSLSFVLILFFLFSCSKQETKVYFDGGTAPALTASASDSIPLNFVDSSKTAVTFSWTNPNYQFSNGISSMNVIYNLEIDTAGASFSSPNMQTVSISSDLSKTFSVADLNKVMANGLLLSTGQLHHIQARVTSFLSTNGTGTLHSNVLDFAVTPYAPPPAVNPPTSGTLFIVGSATDGGWNNPLSVDPATQQFTKVSETEYKITIHLIGGGEYKWIGVNGSWAQQWSVAASDTYPNGGPFIFNGNNCIAPAASGNYLIDVNFQTGKFTVTAQ